MTPFAKLATPSFQAIRRPEPYRNDRPTPRRHRGEDRDWLRRLRQDLGGEETGDKASSDNFFAKYSILFSCFFAWITNF